MNVRNLNCSLVNIIVVSASLWLFHGPALSNDFASVIANGSPWTATQANGRKLTMTLNPDGSGTMRIGPMNKNVQWRATPDGLCLDGLPGGEKCLVLEAVEGGYKGYEDGKAAMSLTR